MLVASPSRCRPCMLVHVCSRYLLLLLSSHEIQSLYKSTFLPQVLFRLLLLFANQNTYKRQICTEMFTFSRTAGKSRLLILKNNYALKGLSKIVKWMVWFTIHFSGRSNAVTCSIHDTVDGAVF